MSDSTKSDNIDLLDAGSARWQLATRYNSVTDEHIPHVTSIDWEHELVHEGKMFSISGVLTALGAGATGYFHGLTDSEIVHFRQAAIGVTGAPVDITFYEDATVSANGSAITSRNRNRNSSNTATLQSFIGPTITDLGTAIEVGQIPVAGPSKQSGEASLFGTEWVLKNSTSYLIEITNNDSQAIDVGYNFLWYEL